jgi:hypothetical protein
VIALLRQLFVPLALDVWYAQRRQDAAGELFRRVIAQREDLLPGRTVQGFYAFAPDGVLLLGWNDRGRKRMKRHLAQVLDGYTPAPAAALTGAPDPLFDRSPPAGARVVTVRSRIIDADWPEPTSDRERVLQQTSGFDHLWILQEECELLRAGAFPAPLALRIARFHCVDNTRGAPPTWGVAEVKRVRVEATPDAHTPGAASIEGEIVLRSADGQRGYAARLAGDVEVRDGALQRFDVAIRGAFFGEGPCTRGAPQGRFTLAIVLVLAEPREHAKAPPHGSRRLDDYLSPDAVLPDDQRRGRAEREAGR